VARASAAPLELTPDAERARVRVDPSKEYVSGLTFGATVYDRLAAHVVEVVGRHGDALYDAMLLDPDVRSAINTLKAAIMADGMFLVSAVRPEYDPAGFPVETPDTRRAEELREECERHVANLDLPHEQINWELLDGIPKGCMAAEVTWTDGAGDLEGLWTLASVRPKPRSSWSFAVDERGRVTGFYPVVAPLPRGGKAPAKLPRTKLAVYAWMTQAGNPAGTPALDACYDPWNMKVLTLPEHWKFNSNFAVPLLYGTTAEGAMPVEALDADGEPTGETISPQRAMLNALLDLPKHKAGVGAYGSDVKILNAPGEGQAFLASFAYWERKIVQAITQQARESARLGGDNANDASTPSDDMVAPVRLGKKNLGQMWRNEVLMPLVEANHGPEAARLTPYVRFGQVDLFMFSRVAGGLARLASAGLIPPGAVPELLAWLGLDGVVKGPLAAAVQPAAEAPGTRALSRENPRVPGGAA
jgi:hypothetical protein